MPVPERLNSSVESHGKNDQPRKNLDKLTIQFFLKTNLWAFSMKKPCQSLSIGKA